MKLRHNAHKEVAIGKTSDGRLFFRLRERHENKLLYMTFSFGTVGNINEFAQGD